MCREESTVDIIRMEKARTFPMRYNDMGEVRTRGKFIALSMQRRKCGASIWHVICLRREKACRNLQLLQARPGQYGESARGIIVTGAGGK